MNSLVVTFDELPDGASAIAGGKGASLSRMARAGLPVPPGFVVCSAAFQAFLESDGGVERVEALTSGLDVDDDLALELASVSLREFILSRTIPPSLEARIRDAYRNFGVDALVAVRSSAASEDSETASFAGQQETFLNVVGADCVAGRVRECWASFFTPRALFYRARKGVLSDTRMAVVIQEMVQADKSGVLFTVDPVYRRRDHMMIEAVLGLGEAIVSGALTPDNYVVDRDNGRLVREFIATQPTALRYDRTTGGTVSVPIAEEVGGARLLSDGELNGLREMGLRLESFFGGPQDVEWCIRGDELLVLQSRPITTL